MPRTSRCLVPALGTLLVLLLVIVGHSDPPPAAPDLDATAKRLTEAVGGRWTAGRDPDHGIIGWLEGQNYILLPYPLDRKGREKLAGYALTNSARLVVIGHGKQWTVIAWERESVLSGAEANSRVLKALGIESREPEVVGGLSVKISADKGWPDPTGRSPQGDAEFLRKKLPPALATPEYVSGEPIKISAEFTNHTDQPIRVSFFQMWTAGGRLVPSGECQLLLDDEPFGVLSKEILVPAKGILPVWLMLLPREGSPRLTREGAELLAVHANPAPGDHALRLVLTCGPKTEEKGAWSGTLRSNEINFTVAPPQPPAKAAE